MPCKTSYPSGLLLMLAACSETLLSVPDAPPTRVSTSTVKFWESNAAADWNGEARRLVATSGMSALAAVRGYAIVSLAQYQAAIAAEHAKDGPEHPSVAAAIGGASVVALTYLFPSAAASLEARLDAVLSEDGWPGGKNQDAGAGEVVGRAAAVEVIARAQTDNFFAAWTGTVPTGPGIWFSATPPVGATIGNAKTYFLTSASQFRPPPHPAYGSAAFTQALNEVKLLAENRTAEQAALAVFWNFGSGTHTPPGYWNETAANLAVANHTGERETAHLLALMNMVAHDILVASHEAKYFYWLLRPTMADPTITTAIGVPNFPAYPSNHAAISAGMARIIGAWFPPERSRLDGLADEAALSRVLGGIHYRFDGTAGLELGRAIAAFALTRDVNGHHPFVLP